MGWTVRQMSLAVLMVVAGSINTLASSWADSTKSEGSDGVTTEFNHPFFQAAAMFLGEALCMGAYIVLNCYKKRHKDEIEEGKGNAADKNIKWRNTPFRFNPFIFLTPALCDMCGTSLTGMALLMTYPSSYQMLRGSLIIFTGLLSVAFLHRTLRANEWTGMFAVLIGLIITGAADFMTVGGMTSNSIITGDLLIVIAQIIVAAQMVLEEKVVVGRDVNPLAAAGCEGLF